ncbi:hypothetical protein IFM89_001203 [Coptis chinensis]|uniref:ARMC9 CTLH-like domain-containing protein n=1 Tax=Coptis chinensis TaxID=261450 RepID=A0A835HK83_9MAGN|nr:hypothetical protein IFM89_001203 [Coptis chinensis]
MENMVYAEELVREFLVFRGFTNTLQAYQTELSTDIGKGFDVDKILDLVFLVYVPKFQADRLVALLSFFKQYVSASTEAVLVSSMSKLEASILRYYIIQAIQSGRKDKVVEFLGTSGNDLLQRGQDWVPWFAIPYLKNPSLDPQFRIFFSKEWFDGLRLSFRNFLSEIFNGMIVPFNIGTEKNTVKRLKKDVKQLNIRLSQLQALLEKKEAQIRHNNPAIEANMLLKSSSTDSLRGTPGKSICGGGLSHLTSSLAEGRQTQEDNVNVNGSAKPSTGSTLSQSEDDSTSSAKLSAVGSGSTDNYQMFRDDYYSVEDSEVRREEEFPEVKVDFQATPVQLVGAAFLHLEAILQVLLWTGQSGTANGGIKAWNVDAKRVVCDLNTTQAFLSVLDLKCSPVEPIFVSAAASRGNGSSNLDNLKYASLTVWNMKTWKPMTVLPLGEDPPAITSLSFNHNGKILAAAATDGMIHIFGWPAHDSAISSVLFGHDETSIFSLGSDGKANFRVEPTESRSNYLVKRLQQERRRPAKFTSEIANMNTNEIQMALLTYQGFCNYENARCCRHEMAFDSTGRRLLVSSGSVRSPIYQVRDHSKGWKTLPHSAAITTVDWHPTLPIFLTGSADNSVRVTSMS